ncbi:MAG: hypothetical protein KAH10_04135 [Flavobacteriales bacterium]|nr:hypothetical protein [Flavobacteriales bacterium]
MIKKLTVVVIAFITIVGSSSCESTGICLDPVTPKLMLGFVDLDGLGNEEDISPPDSLLIYGNRDGKDIIGEENGKPIYLFPNQSQEDQKTNLIALIFDVNRDSLTYLFKIEGVIDTINIKYHRKQSFISQNCGYKSTFYDVEIKNFTTNLILKASIEQTIEYDTERHLKIILK